MCGVYGRNPGGGGEEEYSSLLFDSKLFVNAAAKLSGPGVGGLNGVVGVAVGLGTLGLAILGALFAFVILSMSRHTMLDLAPGTGDHLGN